jgi:retron-type reverse transcriptase
VGRPFVGAVDIKDFFGSIRESSVEKLLLENNFSPAEADLISRLCTKDGVLPQGAPTSPAISNALLFEFDETLRKAAEEIGANYTRYADDITISGHSRDHIKELLSFAAKLLHKNYGLELNDSKTRIASRHGRQTVTGIVVNTDTLPPREKRREIRAIFHNAQKSPAKYVRRISELAGYIGYLDQFPAYKNGRVIEQYRDVISQLAGTETRQRAKTLGHVGTLANKRRKQGGTTTRTARSK